VTQSVFAGFFDYRMNSRFSISGEYGMVRNYEFQPGLHRHGISAYIFYRINRLIGMVIRFDRVTVSNGGTVSDDVEAGNTFIGGFECYPFERVRLAVTYQNWLPEQRHLSDEKGLYFQLEFRY